MFNAEQKRALESPLDPSRVERLKGPNGRDVLKNGKAVGYIEAWDSIEQANRIFGFDGWSCETVTMQETHAPAMRPHPEDATKDVVVASYWAKVRITVYADGRAIVREGCGGATSYQKTFGEAVENAIKSAESDAMKRAFKSFGNQFGLALYDKSYKNVRREELPVGDGRQERAAIDVGFDTVVEGSGRESGVRAAGRAPESAPPVPNSSRALARLPDQSRFDGPRPNGQAHRTNGGMRY